MKHDSKSCVVTYSLGLEKTLVVTELLPSPIYGNIDLPYKS